MRTTSTKEAAARGAGSDFLRSSSAFISAKRDPELVSTSGELVEVAAAGVEGPARKKFAGFQKLINWVIIGRI